MFEINQKVVYQVSPQEFILARVIAIHPEINAVTIIERMKRDELTVPVDSLSLHWPDDTGI